MSNLKFKATFDSYKGAAEFLGDKEEKTLCYATKVHKVGDTIRVRHHDTDIIIYEPDGHLGIANGGWGTSTTTQRLHALTPKELRVYRHGQTIWTCLNLEAGVYIPRDRPLWFKF